MARTWWKYWQFVISFWDWCLKHSIFFWNRRKDEEQDISTEMVDSALVSDVTQISRSSSMSTGSSSVPNVCVTDCDDEAEPYWQIMGELSDGCSNEDGCMGGSDLEGEGKQVLVGICAMAKKSQSKPMKEILTRLEEFEYIKILVFPEEVILKEPVEDWPIVDCLISFHSKGFPLDKAIHYANLRNPFIINNLPMQYDIQDRRRVYAILDSEGIEIPRYAVLDRDSADPKQSIADHELVESEDHVEVNGVTFNKPFVEKPVSAEDHNIYIYYPTSAGGGSQRLFRKIGSRSSVYSPESRVRKTGSYIYEDFMPTDGTDVKVYTVGPDYAHAEARKSPALDGKVERDSEGKEIRYPVILSNAEKLISRKVCLAFKQTVCGFDLLRANGKSFVCDVNGFSFVKNSNKYYDDCAKILGNMILRELAPTLHIPWSVPFQLDDPPIVPTTFGKMMELRCVVAVIRHGDRTPKQKMKVEVRHPKFFEIFAKYDGYKHGHVKLKRPKQLQEILDTARSLLTEIQHRAAGPELEEKQGKLEQLKSVLEMYGHFSGINRKVQMKYQPRGRPRGSSSDDDRLGEPSLVLILKWGGELTPAGRIQAEELGRIFRCMYPGGQGRHLSGEYAGAQGLGLLRLHSTFRHDLKIYASDEGRVQMTAAAFAKGLLALEGELTPILVQMVKSANTNGLLDNDCDSSKYQNMVKTRLHELLQQDREFTREDREQINPGNALSINDAMDFVKNPVKCCQHVQALIQKLMDIVRIKKDDPKTKDAILYHGETWELMGRRWGKIEKDFCTKNKRFDISKIPDIYDCIKYDLQHNNHTLQFDHAEELYIYAKYLADIVIPQEYGLTVQEKMTIGQGICTPLLKKIRADLQRNIEESGEETVNRLNPRYSHGVSSPGRHVRTRLYFTSESHVHSLLTVLRYGGLLDVVKDEQWRRAMEYVSMVSELNYMSQIVVMLYEDPTKDPSSEERFHVELHFSPGVNCCVQKNLPPGPGFRPHSRNESSHNLETTSQCSTRIEEEDAELGVLDDDATISPPQQSDSSPPLIETEEAADSTLDSPTTSRAIDMMDLDPNMMDEPYDSGFLQGSAPIPISARTVAGHEAARLGSQLAASQRQRREREASNICEPRARSYDHQRQEKPEKNDRRRFDLDELFYERVESLASGASPSSRTSAHRNSPGGLGVSPSSFSLYASSPDLSDSLTEVLQTCPSGPQERYDKASEKYSLSRHSRNVAGGKSQVAASPKSPPTLSTVEDNDPWDFGESQLLEEVPIIPRNQTSSDRISSLSSFSSITSSADTSVSSKIAPKSLETVVNIETETPSRVVSLDIKSKPSNTRDVVASTNVETSSTLKAEDLQKAPPNRIRSESQDREQASSSRSGVAIVRGKPQEIPNAKSPSTQRNRVMTCSPSYLGIPVALPHSVSSPELPAPLIETILQSSGPLVTLHNKSLVSPSALSPSRHGSLDSASRADKLLLPSYLPTRQSCNLMPLALQASETKRYGRSKSALTLPTVNDARGEFGSWVPEIISTNISSSPNDRHPIDVTCHHCETSKPTGHECCHANTSRSASRKTEAKTITHSLSLSSSRRASLTGPEPLEEGGTRTETAFGKSPPFLTTFHRPIASLSSPNSRRASLTYLDNDGRTRSTSPCRNCDGRSQSTFSTSLPSRTHSYCPECSNSRRNSTIVLGSRDHEALGRNEDFLNRQDRSFAGRSRSLSPCPQRCLCYNCNVAALIQESVNLSPAERLNFQTYFVRSLSHKFSNCTCYRRSLESAEASRRVSRSASPNSTSSATACWQYPKSNANSNTGNLASFYFHQRTMEHGKRLERRQSSPQHIGSSSRRYCSHCRLRNEFVLAPRSGLVSQKEGKSDLCGKSESGGFRVRESDSLEIVEKLGIGIPVDSLNLVGQSEAGQDEKSNVIAGSFSEGTIDEYSSDKAKSSIDSGSKQDTSGMQSTCSSSLPSAEIIVESDNVVSVDNKSSTDDQVFEDKRKSSSSSISRQLSCPEVVIDASCTYPTGYPMTIDCHCNDCTCGDDDDISNRLNETQGFQSSSSSSLIPPQRKDVRTLRRSLMGRYLPESDAEFSTNFVGSERKYVGKSGISPIRQFTHLTDKNDYNKGDSLGDRMLGVQTFKKIGISLLRQVSCPEIIEDSVESIGSERRQVEKSKSSMDRQFPHLADKNDHEKGSDDRKFGPRRIRKTGFSLPRQTSCPEITEDSSNFLGSEGKHVGKYRTLQDRQFPRSSDENDHDRVASSGDGNLALQKFRKRILSLPRQFSCPEFAPNSAVSVSYSLSCQSDRKSRTTSCCDEQCLKSLNPSLAECSRYCHSTADNCQSTLGSRCKNATTCSSCLNYGTSYDSENNLTTFPGHKRTHTKSYRVICSQRHCTMCGNQRYKSSSPSSHPRLQTQRSFSSPDTRPSIIQEPDPTCTARRHRHSISGQMSYFKLLGYNVSKKLTGSANSLFSTAVISGSSSAPNLKDMVPPHASVVAAIEGFGGVPPIRPLETLHNALSLRQLDSFLDMMTSAPLFRTPASSPPKFPSPGGSIHGVSVVPNLGIGGINREYHSSDLEAVRYITPTPIHYKSGQDGEGNDLRNQLSPTSPNSTGWSSEPQSFLSSEPSSPAPTSAGECSMSMSLVSNDGTQPFAGPKFSATPCLDLDFNDFCMSIDQDNRGDSRGSISYTDYYSNEDGLIRKSGPDLTQLRERAARDGTPQEPVVDEDEEHTLTLRQTEEQRKQDVKFIFEQSKESSPNLVKPSSSYKKIGRFRVESMEIADEDVRIKEAAVAAATAMASSSSSNHSLDQIKGTTASHHDKSAFVGESVAQDSKKLKGGFLTSQSRLEHRGKLIARSHSVSTPQAVCHKTDVDYSGQAAASKIGSFSTMSCEDLENWKATAVSPPASSVVSPSDPDQDEPILTLASSLKNSSNITVGFNVQPDKKD